MSFWDSVWQMVGITASQAVAVVFSSIVLYLVFTTVLRLWGQRLFANRSGFGIAVVLVLGAVIGRSMLGPAPTLTIGLICLSTLILLEWAFGAGKRSGLIWHRHPVVVYVRGELQPKCMRHYHLSEQMIYSTLRRAGVRRLEDVDAIVLEVDGTLTILHDLEHIDDRLLGDIKGIRNG